MTASRGLALLLPHVRQVESAVGDAARGLRPCLRRRCPAARGVVGRQTRSRLHRWTTLVAPHRASRAKRRRRSRSAVAIVQRCAVVDDRTRPFSRNTLRTSCECDGDAGSCAFPDLEEHQLPAVQEPEGLSLRRGAVVEDRVRALVTEPCQDHLPPALQPIGNDAVSGGRRRDEEMRRGLGTRLG